MDENSILILASGVMAAAVGTTAALFQWLLRRRGTERSATRPTSLAAKISETSSLLARAATATAELDDELAARQDVVRKLEDDAAKAKTLAKLHEEGADVFKALLAEEFEAAGQSSRRFTLWVTIGSFSAGVAATWVVAVIVS